MKDLKYYKDRFKNLDQSIGHDGFTLIEILVALFLVALLITSFTMSGSMFDPHRKLEEALDNIERAVRFSQDESVLKNSIVRIVLKADADPNSFTVEYTSDTDFVLPSKLFDEQASLDGYSDEEIEAKKKRVEGQFNKVREFQEEPIEFSDQIRIIGVGTTLLNNLQVYSESSIFFYPSGEKDGAIIILANAEEFATLSIEPFTLDFKRKFYKIEGAANIDDEFFSGKAEELYKDWLSWTK